MGGDLFENSNEAVNGGQLYTLGTHLADYLGGGADFGNGNGNGPTFKIKRVKADGTEEEKTYTNVAEAFEGVGSSFTNIKNEITNQINNEITNVKGDSLVKWNEESKLIKIGEEKEGTKISIANKDGTARIISGIAAGTEDTDAVNFSQLQKVEKDVKEQVAASSFVKQDSETRQITIGKETDGNIINLQNNKDENRTLSGLTGGAISKASHDAVNGSQLFETNDKVAKYFGGGAKYEDSKWNAPEFTVKSVKDDGTFEETKYDTVAAAFEGVGTSITNVQNKVTNDITNKFDEFTQNITNITQQVQGDALLWNDDEQAFVARHKKKAEEQYKATGEQENSKITHLLDGAITSDSTDAITGKQLYSTSNKLATYLDKGAGYDVEGNWKTPNFKVKTVNSDGKEDEQNYTSVAEAFEGVGTSFTNVQNKITNEITNQINHLQSDDSAVVHYDKKDDESSTINYASITFGGKDQTPTALHNIANGNIAKDSRDAITGGQINTIGEDIAKFLGGGGSFKDGTLTQPTYKLSDVSTEGKVTDKSFTDVGSAFAGLDTNIKNVNARIKEVSEGVAQDSLSWSQSDNAFNAQHGTEEKTNSKIKFLAAGDITADSTDAVNGSQLYSLGDNVAKYFGGNAKYEDGKWAAPSFTLKTLSEDGKDITEKTYNDVSSAFAGIDANFQSVNKNVQNIVNDFTEQVTNITQEVQGDALLWDKESKAFVAQHGEKEGKKENSKITSLANGNIASGSTDAVTGGQLYSINEQLANYFGGGAGYDTEGKWKAPTFKVKTVKEDGNSEDKNYTNVADALSGVGTSFTNVQNKITNEITNQINHLQSDDSAVVHYDKNKDETGSINYTSITLGKGANAPAVGLHNIADGQISENSHDAINGSQINAISQNVAKFLGGDAAFNNGALTGPTYKLSSVSEEGRVNPKDFNDVSSAFTGLDENIKNVNNRIKEVSEGVAQDSLNWNNAEGAFVAQHGKESSNSKIKFLANGDVSASSSEAVTGSQLHSLGSSVAKSLGGGAEYKDGVWSSPSFNIKTVKDDGVTIEEKKYDTVAEALADVGASFTNIKNDITNIVSDSLVKQEKEGASITIGHETDGTVINLQNKNNENRILSGVTGGTISKDSIEAVNGSQLFETNDKVAGYFGGGAGYKDGTWTAPTFTVKTVNADGDKEDKTYQNVAAAFEDVSTSITNVQNKVTNDITNITQQVQGDALLWSNKDNAFVADHGKDDEKTHSKLTHLLDGTISKDSTDAITGKQLYSLGANVANSFGGGAEYKGGKWVVPSFKVNTIKDDGTSGEESYKNVADALAGVGSSFTNVQNKITNEINNAITKVEGDSLVKQEKETDPITVGKETGGNLINIANKDQADRTLSGVKAAVNDNEAVNKAQLDQSLEKLSNSLQSDDSAVVLYDKKDDKIDYTSVTFGKGQNAAPVALHNIADGNIAEKSHDAVTGGQINSISQDVAKFLGGDTSFEKGAFTGPTYKLSAVTKEGQVTDKSFTDVGTAFAGLDQNIQNVNDRIKEVSEGVAQDSLSWSKDDDAFSAQHGEGKERKASKITHILDGDITANSNDAVNGSQLYLMNNTLASYFGGGAGYDKGKWTVPSFKVNTVSADGDKFEEKTYHNVAEAFSGVGSSFTNINNQIKQVVSDSLVKQDSDSKIIKIGAEKGGTSISIANSGDAARTLSGVKSGVLSSDSIEAVNGSQLYSMSNTLASYFGGSAKYEDGKWAAPSFKVKTVNSDGSAVEEKSYNSVASAFEGVGASFTNIHKELKNEISQVVSDSLVKQDEKTHVIAVGGEKSGTKVTLANVDNAARTLTGVKAGELSETSTEAVNGSQLFVTNQNVTTVTNDLKTVSENTSKYLGGGADVLKGVAPTYTVQDKSYQSVAEAFGGVDHAFTELHKEIAQNTSDLSDHIKQNALLWSDNDHAFVATHGTDADKKNSKITSLANGNVTEDSTDAVNGSQLYSMNKTLATYFGGGARYENGEWTAPSFTVHTVSEDGSKIEEHSYDDVAQAFASVGTSFSNLHNELKNEISQVVSDSLVKQDKDSKVIKIGAEKEGTEVNISNKDKGDRTLSGVKAAVNDNEAVNKGQFDKGLKDLSNSLQSDDSAVVHYDKQNDGTINYGSVTFGGKGKVATALHNVADGVISENSHDVVTGSQLNTISQDVAKFLGGSASFTEGTFTGPTYKLSDVSAAGNVTEKVFKDIGTAFSGLDQNIQNVNKRIKEVSQGIADDSLLWNDAEGAFVALHGEGKDRKDSKIRHIKSGDIAANSSEAVNGGQLYATNQNVNAVSDNLQTAGTNIANSFGGGARYENGEWTAPSFTVHTVSEDGSKVEEHSYDDVAQAFASVGTSFSNLHNELKNEISQVVSDSLVKQDKDSKVIKIGAEKEGTEITIANSDGAARSLSGVKAGELSAGSTEAVNGSQLYSLNQTLASYFGGGAGYEEGQWTAPSFKVLSFKEDGSSEETSYNNVAAAFAGVNQSFTKLHHDLSDNIEQNALLWSDADEAFVALHGKGSEKHNSKLSHLVDGDISSGSTEAITGNQLYHLNQTLAAYLGGGAGYNDGQWTAPTFSVTQFNGDSHGDNKKDYHDVASAFEGVNGSLSSINERVNEVSQNVTSNSLHWNDELGGYDGRHNGSDSKITHVADGNVEEGSKEVVNGGQLWETNKKVEAVEERVESLDQHVKDVESAVTNGAVNYDKDEEGHKTNKITLVGGNESDPVLIDNVSEGRVESGSKEAVNGGQLHDYTDKQMKLVLEDAKKYTDEHVDSMVNKGLEESKAYTDMKFETLNYAIEDVRKESRQAAAIGLAVSSLRYYDIPGSLSVSFGTGMWRNQSAFAIGAGYTSEDGNIRSNLSVTSAGGHWGVGAGITLRLK